MIDAPLWQCGCGNTATHRTPDSRGLSIASFPSIISADCTDFGLIHHHQSPTNKVNVHQKMFTIHHRQPTTATVYASSHFFP
jgi:hypothetical protein